MRNGQVLMRFNWALWLLPIVAFAAIIFSMSESRIATNWLQNEAGYVLSWWFIVTLGGIAVFPLIFRLLSSLADRGYGLARLAGLLLITAVFWLLTSLGVLQNSPSAIATAWILVSLLSILAWMSWPQRPNWGVLRAWFKEHWPYILIYEILFLVALFAWGYLRAHNPELNSTEKPMEMAFINGVRNSVSFPPKDPWLAGYGISYYYMGYVMIAGLADLSAVPTTMAFNLMTVLIFALVTSGALSIGYNLVRSIDRLGRWPAGSRFAGIGTGLFAATLIGLSGHLGTALVELPYQGYAANIPLADKIIGNDYFQFWDILNRTGPFYEPIIRDSDVLGYRLLDTGEIVNTPPSTHVRAPDRDGDGVLDWYDGPPEDNMGFNWWQQSRLVHDRNLSGLSIPYQPIAEFPQFSFLLADNHPHVLALPFTLLMIGLAMALALRDQPLEKWEVLIYGILVGGMIFLNAWDAIYALIIVAAELLRRLLKNGTGHVSGLADLWQVSTLQKRAENNLYIIGLVWLTLFGIIIWQGIVDLDIFMPIDVTFQAVFALMVAVPLTLLTNWLMLDTDLSAVVRFGISLGLCFVIFYYPWLASFSSQANGFYPNVIFPTRSSQFFLQFGIFILPLIPFIVWQARHARSRLSWAGVFTVVVAGLILLLSVPLVSAFLIEQTCPLTNGQPEVSNADTNWACLARAPLYGEISNVGLSIVSDVIERRTTALASQVVMLLLLGVVLMRLFPVEPRRSDPDRRIFNFSPTTGFALLLIGAGIVATLIPDVMYLRDNFSQRMNTVFKLYYQAWTLLSIGTAYAVYFILSGKINPQKQFATVAVPSLGQTITRSAYGVMTVALLAMGLTYPYFGLRQHYLGDSGRLNVRNCNSSQCPTESAATLDGGNTLVGAYATYVNRAGLDVSWTIGSNEYQVMQCLHEKEGYGSDAVLLEAAGGGYDPALGRFSMYTGIPTLLGWDNHEEQWRGENFSPIVYGSGRFGDIHIIYESLATEWEVRVKPLLERYGIDYIVVGRAERLIYSDALREPLAGIEKFSILFDPICQAGDTAVYRVSAK